MKRILLGGSPCTFWSIAQKNNRETEASGIGWELFKNYLVAKEKFKPDYFLYENNVSAAQPIKDQIKRELNVWDGTFLMPYTDVRYIEINSALVSAQNRKRFYVLNCGEVGQPKNRGILLRDVLESGYDLTANDKSFALTTRCNGAIPEDTLEKHRHTMVAEPVIFQLPHGYNDGGMKYGKSPTLTANACWQDNNKIIEPVGVGYRNRREADGKLYRRFETSKSKRHHDSANRQYGCCTATSRRNASSYCYADGKIHTAYEVKDGRITIKGKEYPIKLVDGFYIIRKLTVAECRRLQTIPDWYKMPCSNSQNYKMLGNGWTVEVIKHILSHIPEIGRGEPIEVLSMYDGMSCGQIALKELGANVVRYYATEIDKYAIQTTQANFPGTIQLGDAFQVRNENWSL